MILSFRIIKSFRFKPYYDFRKYPKDYWTGKSTYNLDFGILVFAINLKIGDSHHMNTMGLFQIILRVGA